MYKKDMKQYGNIVINFLGFVTVLKHFGKFQELHPTWVIPQAIIFSSCVFPECWGPPVLLSFYFFGFAAGRVNGGG